MVIVFPLGAPSAEMYARGVSVAIVSVTRNSPRAIDPAVKSGNYLNNVLALGEARRRSGAYEAILCAADGSVAEGASSNVFTVVGGEVRTPPLEVGILDGITRGQSWICASKTRFRWPNGASHPPSCAPPTRCSSPARPAACCPWSESTNRPIGKGTTTGPVILD